MSVRAFILDIAENVRAARFDRNEIGGSLGDLGTFLPLLVAMATINGLDFASSLFFAGVFSVLTGLMFRIPMAVQPMKAIAAVAIAQGLTPHEITAAGAMVSFAVLVLGLMGAIGFVQRIIPVPVVRGMQCALGVTLVFKAWTLAMTGAGVASAGDVLSASAWTSASGLGVTIGAAAVVVVALGVRRFPAALVLFAGGIALAVIADGKVLDSLSAGLTLPSLSIPALNDLPRACFEAALPQLPLTTLNSVVSVCALSVTLYPSEPRKHAGTRVVAVSVGLMNLVGVWFGAMPMCHGAGGLAGQHRFGARTNGSILMLGAAKIVLAVVFGASLLPMCAAFPKSVLAVMLVVSGAELVRASVGGVVRDCAAALVVFSATAVMCLVFGHLAIGVGVGLVVAWTLRWITNRQPPSRSAHRSSSA